MAYKCDSCGKAAEMQEECCGAPMTAAEETVATDEVPVEETSSEEAPAEDATVAEGEEGKESAA